ncbi:MAG: hypothetical protein LUD50_03965 [Clostridia bacterium]|nr:hypothetical protein [Clostridia bacterium]
MALAMQEKKKMQNELNERKKAAQVQEMHESAEETLNEADKQKEYHYAEMMKCVQKKDYRTAKMHARMYNFMDKLSKVMNQYKSYLEDMEVINQTFRVLNKMNSGFSTLLGSIGNTSDVSASMVSNMQKFSKQLAKYDKSMNQMMDAMDMALDGGTTSKRGRKGAETAPVQTDEEAFMAILGQDKDLADRFKASGGPASAAEPADAPAAPAESLGDVGSRGGVDNPFGM